MSPKVFNLDKFNKKLVSFKMTKNNENKANLVSFFITELNVHASLAIWKQF